MALYEVVREIGNSCSGNQMRDVFFDEIDCRDLFPGENQRERIVVFSFG